MGPYAFLVPTPFFGRVRVAIAASAFGLVSAASASGMDSLEQFVKTAQSGRAEFTQVVTSATREGQPARTKMSSGTFEFSRPNRFRFDYRKPFAQTIVADGQTLWWYDVDLNQVTARSQDKALSTTPAAVFTAAADLAAVRRDFELESAPDRDGLEWVVATPKLVDGQLRSVRVGFKDGSLAVLEILDSFGQRSVLRFSHMQLNSGVAPQAFHFVPPKGADLIEQR